MPLPKCCALAAIILAVQSEKCQQLQRVVANWTGKGLTTRITTRIVLEYGNEGQGEEGG